VDLRTNSDYFSIRY